MQHPKNVSIICFLIASWGVQYNIHKIQNLFLTIYWGYRDNQYTYPLFRFVRMFLFYEQIKYKMKLYNKIHIGFRTLFGKM